MRRFFTLNDGYRMLRLPIAEGNDRHGRLHRLETVRMTSAEAYARVIGEVDSLVRCVPASPAEADGGLPRGLGQFDFDERVFTGSSLKTAGGRRR